MGLDNFVCNAIIIGVDVGGRSMEWKWNDVLISRPVKFVRCRCFGSP